MKNLALLLSLVLLFSSCSDPLDKIYSENNSAEDLKAIKRTLDSADLMLLGGTMIRLKLEGRNLEIMTYKEILDDGKKYRAAIDKKGAEEKRLAEEAIKAEADRIQRLSGALTVSLFEKGYSEYDYEEYITYKFAFDNKTDKNIKAFTGTLYLNDLFDKEITFLNLTYDEGVNAKSKKTWNASTEFNKFRDQDQQLKSKTIDQLKVIWKPEKILFEDGSMLE